VTQQVVCHRDTARPQNVEALIGTDLRVVSGSSYLEALQQLQKTQPKLAWREIRAASAMPLLERIAGIFPLADEADVGPFVGQERTGGSDAEILGEQGAVADLRMGVEGKMAGVDGEVSLDERFEPLVLDVGERLDAVPKHPVVNDEKVDACVDGRLKGPQTGVDRGADLGDRTIVRALEAVVGAGKIFHFARSGALFAEFDDFVEFGHGLRDVLGCRCLGEWEV